MLRIVKAESYTPCNIALILSRFMLSKADFKEREFLLIKHTEARMSIPKGRTTPLIKHLNINIETSCNNENHSVVTYIFFHEQTVAPVDFLVRPGRRPQPLCGMDEFYL